MLRSLALLATVAAAPAFAATNISIGTAAYTVSSFDASGNPIAGNVSMSGDTITNNNTPFWTATTTFTAAAGTGTLAFTNILADDAVVVELNGTPLVGAGIFGPGTGQFYFSPTIGSVPFTFLANGASGSTPVTLLAGTNTITLIVNNNNNGIHGGTLQGGPSEAAFDGTITSNASGAPEPATWGLMLAGFGLVGYAARRRAFAAA